MRHFEPAWHLAGVTEQRVEIPNLARLPELGERLLPMLDELRESQPVVWSDAIGGWLVLRHADALAGLTGRYPLSSEMLSARIFGGVRRRRTSLHRSFAGANGDRRIAAGGVASVSRDPFAR